ncbi:MotA/TolQ/ExbB proton channel family protein [Roseivivax marinus]|uniref:MotA/TolQ/ExbB proton channel family protein n=1 Tax=Roseivivax marinus TaxID=1379903 RepID=UPI001F038495|nr:MotA/TolQ/ExbB proton channel family protein [Roseivivax marinus]UMA66206.1 MotA/TolQ/ExbB proton channel family protein [Roseivivax marinus]
MTYLAELIQSLRDAAPEQLGLLFDGGPVIWLIAALSILTVALVLWKAWRLALIGAWSGGRRAERAVAMWESGDVESARRLLSGRRTCRAVLARSAMDSFRDPHLSAEAAEQETVRVAKRLMARLRSGLRPLELIATIAPLLGLLGTVLGMIAAFQALQEAGSRADPATLAGGIWEALLTTAAGMAVAIPASAALTWFEAVADRLRHEMEDLATRLSIHAPAPVETGLKHAAE